MATKTICLLANSAKNKARCIAGSEVELATPRNWHLKNSWIRPVSHRPKGELNDSEVMTRRDGKPYIPRLMDLVEIQFDGSVQVEGQPEDWLITKGEKWLYKGSLNAATCIPKLLEMPDDLWLQKGQRIDRATPAFVAANPRPSLYLIKPDTFEVHIEKRTWDGRTTAHRWAYFLYRGTEYRFGLTDLVFTEKFCPRPWQMDSGLVSGAPISVSALCVSLSPPFSFDASQPKAHYKLVAGVLM